MAKNFMHEIEDPLKDILKDMRKEDEEFQEQLDEICENKSQLTDSQDE